VYFGVSLIDNEISFQFGETVMNDKSSPSRDFIGYADDPPAVVWPDEARIAINFCINYEEGGELCILNGDDRSEVRVSDVEVSTRLGHRDLITPATKYVAFRASDKHQIKAQLAGNGCSIDKSCNAELMLIKSPYHIEFKQVRPMRVCPQRRYQNLL
jgi:hypothetical protein